MNDYLKSIHLINFKNFEDFEAEFSQINCFVGRNGVGKTNVLEAIHYLAMCKPYFYKNYEEDNIRFNENFFAIHGYYGSDDIGFNKFSCSLKLNEKKKFRCNETPYQRLSEHIGLIPIVVVSPSDHVIVSGSADNQRVFLNYTLSQCDSEYIEVLKDYTKSLEMRNRILKMFQVEHCFDYSQLESIDHLMSLHGNKIRAKREKLCKDLQESLIQYYNILSSGTETADLQYESFEEDMLTVLQKNIQRDFSYGYTSAGIHKDRLDLTINGHKVRNFGSQGQQKSYLLALKLAQYDYISKQQNGRKPILLLDDIFDKFDFMRVCQLLNLLSEYDKDSEYHFGQIFITDTHLNRIEEAFSQTNGVLSHAINEKSKIFMLE
ncbi:MAG: DNA replication and repair protein RecF [Bacteroidales bacterium]|jgi:DNA replication and repair protein RecF|nr:DNA replication and repair protein RecF [Bacteroidales bacterium]